MKTMTYTEAKERFSDMLEVVLRDREEVVVTRPGQDPVVVVPYDYYVSMKETAYLKRSAENAQRVATAIARLRSSAGAEHSLIER